MEHPSDVVRGFYEFCRQCIRQIRERPKIAQVIGEVFTFEQAFWIHVVSMALCTWDDDAEHEIRLSEIFRVYLTIYREEIDKKMSLESESIFLKVLKYKYDKANKIFHEDEESKVGLHLAHLALGRKVNVIRLTLASLDIPAFAASTCPLPFRLVEDI